jgi:hypothetical protein
VTARRISHTLRPSSSDRKTGSLVRCPTRVMLLTAGALVLTRSDNGCQGGVRAKLDEPVQLETPAGKRLRVA